MCFIKKSSLPRELFFCCTMVIIQYTEVPILINNLITATIAFLATDIDDLVIMFTFYMTAKTTNPKIKQNHPVLKIFSGELIAYLVILLLSDVASYGLRLFPKAFTNGLGAVPLFMGIKILWDLHEEHNHKRKSTAKNIGIITLPSILSICLADGGDNLGVYIPLFSSLSMEDLLGINIYLLALMAIWCVVGFLLSKLNGLNKVFQKYGSLITGTILIILGFILIFK